MRQLVTIKFPEEDDLPNAHLKHLSKQDLLSEILRKRPNYKPAARTTKGQLIEVLSSILIDSKSAEIEVKDMRSLVMAARQNRNLEVE